MTTKYTEALISREDIGDENDSLFQDLPLVEIIGILEENEVSSISIEYSHSKILRTSEYKVRVDRYRMKYVTKPGIEHSIMFNVEHTI